MPHMERFFLGYLIYIYIYTLSKHKHLKKIGPSANIWRILQILVRYRLQNATHVNGIFGPFRLCDIVSAAETFKTFRSSFLKKLRQAWMWVSKQMHWDYLDYHWRWDFAACSIQTFSADGVQLGYFLFYKQKLSDEKFSYMGSFVG